MTPSSSCFLVVRKMSLPCGSGELAKILICKDKTGKKCVEMKVNIWSLSYYYQRQKSTVELEDGLSQHPQKDSLLFYAGFIHWIPNSFLCSSQSKLLYTLKRSFLIFELEKYSIWSDCCIMHQYALFPGAQCSLKSRFIAFTISFVELEKYIFFYGWIFLQP